MYGPQFNTDRDINISHITPADTRNQRNHVVLRQVIRRFWIDGVLKSSLYNEMIIHLGLESSTDTVDNCPWDLILQQPNQPDRAIASPSSKCMVQ